jgi:selenide, water dikinase
MKDIEKRKRVMARSMRLGHCICNAKNACPCDIFIKKDLCPCAGERDNGQIAPVRLMEMVESAGCASKIDQATLKRVLHGLPFFDDPRVLVGAPAGDDAGIYKLDDDLALVQTVDVFTPSVDDPYTFGQIAAANSLSDVYAMGGRPITALSIVGFPIRSAPDHAMKEILRGGVDKMAEAGVAIIGGHSINDNEIKAGFAVTGLVHPDNYVTNAGAKPGDRLILTKPLGTGIIAFASQIGRATQTGLEAAARSMAMLNKIPAKLMTEFGASACTDVTGFGLMGHLSAMAAASRVDVEIIWDDLPLLPGVDQCLADGIASGSVERNRESSSHSLIADENVLPAMQDLCFDPQTSGGLLISIRPEAAGEFLDRLHAEGITDSVIIGKVLDTCSGRVFLRSSGRRPLPSARTTSIKDKTIPEEKNTMSCCESSHGAEQGGAGNTGGAAAAQQKFQEFLQAANEPGALDRKTKQAIAIALSVHAKCEPCVKSHVKKARDMGFSQEEIDEAAWMGIAFGGSPTMAFYKRVQSSGFRVQDT